VIRHTSCELLVQPYGVARCKKCRDYRKALYAMLSRHQSRHCDSCDPGSHTNYRYLISPEKKERLARLQHQHCTDQQIIARLRAALDKAIEERALSVGDDLHAYCSQIVKECSSKVIREHPVGSFARLFWDSQQQACSLKDICGVSYLPFWCVWSFHLPQQSFVSGPTRKLFWPAEAKRPSQRKPECSAVHAKYTSSTGHQHNMQKYKRKLPRFQQ
jgi:hypothetical protein